MTGFKGVVDCDKAWKLLLEKTKVVDECLVVVNPGSDGYGKTMLGGVSMRSHRASYIINKNGGRPIPCKDESGNRLVIRHVCPKQNTACVNPLHLELGTASQNSFEDRIADGTLQTGEKGPNNKITESLAQEIKNSLRPKGHPLYMTQVKRAKKFGVSDKIVSTIDTNRTWAHLPDRFGVIKPNTELRQKNRETLRRARSRQWDHQDFIDAGDMLKTKFVESDEGKAGCFPPGPCHIWKTGKAGEYGKTTFKGRPTRAHILVLESIHKRHLGEHEVVRHLCDNKPCMNPEHLRFGTQQENAADIQLHGSSKRFKVDADKVRQIRESTASIVELSNMYGICENSVYNIKSRRTWSAIL